MHEEKLKTSLNKGFEVDTKEVQKILEEFKVSGLSQKEFCRQKELSSYFFRKYSSFREVKQRIKKKPSQNLIELPFLEGVSQKGYEIIFNTEKLSVKLSGEVPQELLIALIRQVTR
jgi:hypothetical protein